MGYDGKVVFEIDADTKLFDAQIEETKKELGKLLKIYADIETRKPYKNQKKDLQGVQVEIEKTNNKLVSLRKQQAKLSEESTKTGKAISNGFENGLKTVKRLVMGVIGIRSAYMLARKAASAYMSQDTELTEKMQQAWVNLGAFLEPFLSWVADAMLKLTGYLNEFIKALTGTDYLARANAKALEKQTKEQAKLNKEMDKYQKYDFDVIRTQSSTGSGGTSTTGESGLGTLGDVELNQNLVKGIQNIASAIKDIIDLITFKEAREAVDEYVEAEKIALDTAENLNQTLGDTTDLILKNPDNKTPEEMKKALNDYQELIGDFDGTIRNLESAKKDYTNLIINFPILTTFGVGGLGNREKQQVEEWEKVLQKQVYGLIQLGKQGKLTKSQYKNLIDNVSKYGIYIDEVKDVTDKYSYSMEDLEKILKDYGNVYPNVMLETLGFAKASEKTEKELKNLNQKFKDGKISAMEYGLELFKVPKKVETDVTVKNLAQSGKDVATYLSDYINKIPTQKNTTFKVEDKEAENKTNLYEAALSKLPNSVVTILKATVDTTEADNKLLALKQKFENMGIFGGAMSSIFKNILGFAGGGYVSQPTFAMVGEGKYNEYIIPEGEDYISRLANEIGKYGSGSNTTNVYLDGRLIQRQVDNTRNRINFTKNR